MAKHLDENELRALFAAIEVPPGLDRWRERIADVHPEPHDPLPEAVDPEDLDHPELAAVVTLPTSQELRPRRQRKRSVAAAAAAVVLVGLGGVAVMSQLFTESPPADPTMTIDGPDKTISSPPTTVRQSTSTSAPTTTSTNGQPPSRAGETAGGRSDQGSTGGPAPDPGTPVRQPSWPPMVGDPSADNTGVPLGATLGDHFGDLRIVTAGQVVTDLRVTGSVVVEAPNVVLRRVIVVAPYATPAVRQQAANLTIEDSELSGGESVSQRASGLVVRRSRLEAGATLTSGAQLYDNFLNGADVLVSPGSTGVLMRHNVAGRVTMNDLDGPIRSVTIENGVLTQVDAPTEPGSASIHVLGNRFRGTAPSTGWNPGAADYRWSGNTYLDSGAPANP
jgi:hypothetical protein